MAWMTKLGEDLKKIVLIEHKIDQLGSEMLSLRKDALDHERRLVRIETMMEFTGFPSRPVARTGEKS